MPESTRHMRTLYEIALSIGGCLDLEIMARSALSTYHSKLHCLASSLICATPKGGYVYFQLGQKASALHTPLLDKYNQMVDQIAPEQIAPSQSGQLHWSQTQDLLDHYIFDLPNFGALALSVETNTLPDIILNALPGLNINFAVACIACVKNEDFRTAEEETRRALNVKTVFLSNMSHEFRTPMNAVIGFGNLLQRNSKPEKVVEYANRIVESAEKLMILINDILDFNSIDSKKNQTNVMSFKLKSEILSTLAPLQRLASAKGIELTITIGSDSNLQIATNIQRLCQVLTKITENAAKFCNNGDKINVICEPSVIDTSGGEAIQQILHFHIIDTGPGIPGPLKKNLFDPFQQADDSNQRIFHGTGLGLALCKKIVTQAGGDIALMNSKKGCYIQFTWPCLQRVNIEPNTARPT